MPRIEAFDEALIIPTTFFGRPAYDGGVCDANGKPVELAQHVGGGQINRTLPHPGRPPQQRLYGRWLFGGWYRTHFGHFINESLGRLWTARAASERFDGIAMLKYRPSPVDRTQPLWPSETAPLLHTALGVFGVGLRTVLIGQPHVVDMLVVPEQLRLGEPGADVLRKAFARAAPGAAPPPGLALERVYVSRAGMAASSGKFVLEELVEQNFARCGYGVFRPERYSLAQQIAVYRNAKVLVFAEGSAVHLAAMFLRPGQRAAILWRGWRRTPHILRQLTDAVGETPLNLTCFAGVVFTAQTGSWGVNERRLLPLHNFAQLGNRLASAGLVDRALWRVPSSDKVTAGIEAALGALRQELPKLKHAYVQSATRPPQMERPQERDTVQAGPEVVA